VLGAHHLQDLIPAEDLEAEADGREVPGADAGESAGGRPRLHVVAQAPG